MGEFDLETDAALAQLNYDELAKMPGAEFAEIVGDLLALIGTGGLWAVAGGTSNLMLKVRRLAGASYANNLIYALTAVRNDLQDLYQKHAELRERIVALPADPRFTDAVAALALRAMHTTVRDRLRRLARILVNGIRENGLEPERVDDMLRAAVELTERDILFLQEFSNRWGDREAGAEGIGISFDDILIAWQAVVPSSASGKSACMASVARLQGQGFVHSYFGGGYASSTQYDLLEEGKEFLQRLKEIGEDEAVP